MNYREALSCVIGLQKCLYSDLYLGQLDRQRGLITSELGSMENVSELQKTASLISGDISIICMVKFCRGCYLFGITEIQIKRPGYIPDIYY